ncbi:ATP-dependent RNA helicase DOB1, related, partial [Eimeria tenella]
TLAVGLNLPARTVVFTDIKKPDGERLRPLHAAEYTQMAGRAGRRGLDTCGNVYIFAPEEVPSPKDLTTMMVERAQPLCSRFRLSYQTLLLLHAAANSLSIETLIRSSFREAAKTTQRPVLKRDLRRCQKALASMPPIDCVFGKPTIREYAETQIKLRKIAQKVYLTVWQNRQASSSVFAAGRVVYVHSISPLLLEALPAAIINIDFVPLVQGEAPTFCLLVLFPSGFSVSSLEDPRPKTKKDSPPPLTNGTITLKGLICTGAPSDSSWGPPLGGPPGGPSEGAPLGGPLGGPPDVEDLGLGAPGGPQEWAVLRGVSLNNFQQVSEAKIKGLEFDAADPVCCNALATLEKEQRKLAEALTARSLELYPDLLARQRVLNKFGFVHSEGTPTLKGRVACQVISGDELTLVEFVFRNGLKDLTPCEIAGVLSAFVGGDKQREETPAPTTGLQNARAMAETIHLEILAAQRQEGLAVADEDWWKLCNFDMALVAYEWARGLPFVDVMRLTSLQEGSVVRNLLRLDELLRKLGQAMNLSGDSKLAAAVLEASNRIRRDIVFATSLYLQ